ncbi:MAG: NF038130 family PEP-CTERM protein [Scytonema sp. PMC 1069.18]|nr:NF038130 family PEP-CTERM protein [Scytonema sp. PMC 1069.18]MEC4886759.1 NF038130 family PEP-CTERM protein [Scytonema sp. PMC 1070.18]
MNRIVKKLLIGASITVGVSAIASTPASAGSLTNVSIGGTAASDYLVYDTVDGKTVPVPGTSTNVQKVLDGNAANPTGNVELRASSEQGGFDFTKNTTLTGEIGGQNLTLSSLTHEDWFGTSSGIQYSYGANNFATKWFNDFLTAAGKGYAVGNTIGNNAYNTFYGIGGFQKSSDPNISYVNQDDSTGLIKIGLAGHYDLKAYYASNQQYAAFAQLLPNGFQASEVVKYTYNGVTDFLYNFQATASGLTASDDGASHNGNYEVTIKGQPVQSTPEPSVILGILTVSGMFATQRRLKKA